MADQQNTNTQHTIGIPTSTMLKAIGARWLWNSAKVLHDFFAWPICRATQRAREIAWEVEANANGWVLHTQHDHNSVSTTSTTEPAATTAPPPKEEKGVEWKVGRLYKGEPHTFATELFQVIAVHKERGGTFIDIVTRHGERKHVSVRHELVLQLSREVEVWKTGDVLRCPWQDGVYGVVLATSDDEWFDVALTDGRSWWCAVGIQWFDLIDWSYYDERSPIPPPYFTTKEPLDRVGSWTFAPTHPCMQKMTRERVEKWEAEAAERGLPGRLVQAPWQKNGVFGVELDDVIDDGTCDIVEGKASFTRADVIQVVRLRFRKRTMKWWPFMKPNASTSPSSPNVTT